MKKDSNQFILQHKKLFVVLNLFYYWLSPIIFFYKNKFVQRKFKVKKNHKTQKQIIDKYAGRILAYTLYAQGPGAYYIKDFINIDYLKYPVLGEISDHESDITSDGYNFLQEYYGFSKLASILHYMDWYSEEYNTAGDILTFLKNMQPYEATGLIEKARNMDKDRVL